MINRNPYKFTRGGVNQIDSKEPVFFYKNDTAPMEEEKTTYDRMEVLKPERQKKSKPSKFQKQ